MKRFGVAATGMLASVLLAACAASGSQTPVVVSVRPAPLHIAVQAQGTLKAVKATTMNVPGQMWSSRQLAWMLPDGSKVKKGEVVARFSARQSKQDLAVAVINLALNHLQRDDIVSQLATKHGQLNVNLAQVATQLAIANRYANATIEAIARNKILDAVENRHYLTTRQGVLEWRQHESARRGQVALGVIGAKRATLDITAKQKRADLNALVLHAPHAGILMLHANWSGQKPQVGSTLTAGQPFAGLPDLAHLEVLLQVPQIEAQGVQPGLVVKLHPLGNPAQSITSKVTWVAGAAAPISSKNPVKYLAVKVAVPAAAEQRYGWVPGLRFAGSIVLLDGKHVMSVPNIALDTQGDMPRVRVVRDGRIVLRKITLGVQGPARSQVLSGLKAGDRVVLERRSRPQPAKGTSTVTGKGALS